MSEERTGDIRIRRVPEDTIVWLDVEAAKNRTSREELLRQIFIWLQSEGIPLFHKDEGKEQDGTE